MPKREHLLKIGVSGIRGVVGEFLTPQLACSFAQAFGTYVGAGRVVVGRDTRASGEMLQHAVTCGLLAAGCQDLVVEAGLKLYDFAALAPVVIGAGGSATDWHGRPLGRDSDGRVLTTGDARLHAQALALLGADLAP